MELEIHLKPKILQDVPPKLQLETNDGTKSDVFKMSSSPHEEKLEYGTGELIRSNSDTSNEGLNVLSVSVKKKLSETSFSGSACLNENSDCAHMVQLKTGAIVKSEPVSDSEMETVCSKRACIDDSSDVCGTSWTVVGETCAQPVNIEQLSPVTVDKGKDEDIDHEHKFGPSLKIPQRTESKVKSSNMKISLSFEGNSDEKISTSESCADFKAGDSSSERHSDNSHVTDTSDSLPARTEKFPDTLSAKNSGLPVVRINRRKTTKMKFRPKAKQLYYDDEEPEACNMTSSYQSFGSPANNENTESDISVSIKAEPVSDCETEKPTTGTQAKNKASSNAGSPRQGGKSNEETSGLPVHFLSPCNSRSSVNSNTETVTTASGAGAALLRTVSKATKTKLPKLQMQRTQAKPTPRKPQSKEKKHVCGVCQSAFSRTYLLKRHMRTHTGEKPYLCNICLATFAWPWHLKEHIRTHTGEKPYVCLECGSGFTSSSDLKVHNRIHTGERPYICRECGDTFTRSDHYKVHKRTHTGEKPYVCQTCGSAFTRSSHYKLHMRTHTGEKPYVCEVCGSAFAQSSQLKVHTKTHTGEKPYVCMECGSAFTVLCNYKKHVRTHTGERPFVCKECGAAFAEQGNLKRHTRTHSDEKPFICIECSSAFREPRLLKRHMKIHTGVKPFVCKECGAAYVDSDRLKRHTSRKHTTDTKYLKADSKEVPSHTQVSTALTTDSQQA